MHGDQLVDLYSLNSLRDMSLVWEDDDLWAVKHELDGIKVIETGYAIAHMDCYKISESERS